MRQCRVNAQQRCGVRAAALGLLVVGLLLPLGCQAKKKEEPKAAEQAAEQASQAKEETRVQDASAAAMKAPGIKVNGEKIATVKLGDDTELLSIAGLPPIDDWQQLVVRNMQGREFRATKPSVLTGERTMKIVRSDDGSYEFMVMQETGADEIIRHRMPQVKVIEVHHLGYTPPAPPTTPKGESALPIKANGATRQLNAQALEEIPKTPEPEGEKMRDTWLLFDILGKPELAPGQELLLRGPGESEIIVKAEELKDSSTQHFIKRNRRGFFHYRVWSGGASAKQKGGMRNLVSIEVR